MITITPNLPKVALALGGGSARGWSHIGVIQELDRIGIRPDIVCGCSIGAIVGAAYAAGNIGKLETWVRSLTRIKLARYFELNISLNGIVDRQRLQEFFQEHVCGQEALIEDLAIRFATVSTDLKTGKEVWFQTGPLLDSVWASMALPGLFPPIRYGDKWLVDGGLVNPVPISICRALGADIVIAVNLNGDIVGKHFVQSNQDEADSTGVMARFKKNIRAYKTTLFGKQSDDHPVPSLFDVITGSMHIAQDRITRSRMAGDPPDVLLSPRLSHIGLLEFHRADESIQEGRACVDREAAEISRVMKQL
jgi:NTE family protein